MKYDFSQNNKSKIFAVLLDDKIYLDILTTKR